MLLDPSTQPTDTNEERLPWHKPWVEEIRVSLDTGALAGSGPDGEGGEEFLSDRQLKQDIEPIDHALERLEGMSEATGTGEYVKLVPWLAEAIKEQHVMLARLKRHLEERD